MSLLACLLVLSPASPTDWHVDASAPPGGNGTPSAPFQRIDTTTGALGFASGDRILVSPGTYADEQIDFGSIDFEVIGVGGASVTTVLGVAQAGPSASIVRMEQSQSSSSRLQGLTLSGGFGSDDLAGNRVNAGGALFLVGASPVIQDCTFDGCNGINGGAVYVRNAAPRLEGCEFLNCVLAEQGAAVLAFDATLQLASCRVDSCEVVYQFPVQTSLRGAVAATDSNVLISECTFQDNYAFSSPAALTLNGSIASVVGSTFDGNFADFGRGGGSIGAMGGSLTMVDCLVARSFTRKAPAGGVHLASVQFVARDCTFESCACSPYEGGAIQGSGDADLQRCLFKDCTAYRGGGVDWEAGTLLISDSAFIGNRASSFPNGGIGGALRVLASNAEVSRCTFENNEAVGNSTAGGLGAAIAGGVTITHSVFVGNTISGPPSGEVVAGGFVRSCAFWDNSVPPGHSTQQFAYCAGQGPLPGVGNVVADPLFWGSGDYHVLPGSPLINAGDPLALADPDGSRADVGRFPFDPLHCGPGCVGDVGQTYCSSFPNSTGQIAQTHLLGSETVLDELLIVSASGLPPQVAGLMIASRTPSYLPFFAGSDGALCLGGRLLRFDATPVVSGPSGQFSLQLDFNALPLGQAVLSGDLWHFQYWFRDSTPTGATSNTTSATRVQFGL